jgi:transcriptional regulator with XRE-family HTH domain
LPIWHIGPPFASTATAIPCRQYQLNHHAMPNEFSLDLKVARRKSGLTQEDCAHLLDVHPSKVSLLESGKTLPSIKDICALSLIYGRSFESLFSSIVANANRQLRDRLRTMPEAPIRWLGSFNRRNTLSAVTDRLETLNDEDYEAA